MAMKGASGSMTLARFDGEGEVLLTAGRGSCTSILCLR